MKSTLPTRRSAATSTARRGRTSNTGLLIFDIPTIIATISAGVTLRSGDVIATGTPAGVGIGFDPPKYLKDGDVVTVEIAGIGTLRNECRRRE